jgi:hypothetical protein
MNLYPGKGKGSTCTCPNGELFQYGSENLTVDNYAAGCKYGTVGEFIENTGVVISDCTEAGFWEGESDFKRNISGG